MIFAASISDPIIQSGKGKLEYLAVYGHASMGGLCMDCINHYGTRSESR